MHGFKLLTLLFQIINFAEESPLKYYNRLSFIVHFDRGAVPKSDLIVRSAHFPGAGRILDIKFSELIDIVLYY